MGCRMNAVEIEVQFENVDVCLAKKSPLPFLDMARNHAAQVRLAHAAFLGHLRDLEVGGGRRDIWIEA